MAIFHEEDLAISEIAFVTEAGVARGLGIEAVLPLRVVRTRIRFEDMEHQPIVVPNGSIHHRNETLSVPGDPWLLVHGARGVGGWTVAARAGVSIPVGRTEPNPFALGRLGLPHQHIQFGTGTWDPVVGLAAGHRFGQVGFVVHTLARLVFGTNDHGYRAGDRLFASAAFDRRIAGTWRGIVGMDLAREHTETWDGRIETEGNLGRTDLLASIGLTRPLGSNGGVHITAKIPLLTRATGAQVRYPVIVAVGLSY
ncbi:MAG: hypothetical protein DMF82_14375 [Acidobacteria bacterium]|nr:MAG: hypothetical protein DMF82_14375 [Acidobacteriota bacterium]